MATAGDILYFAGRTNGDVRDFMIDALQHRWYDVHPICPLRTLRIGQRH